MPERTEVKRTAPTQTILEPSDGAIRPEPARPELPPPKIRALSGPGTTPPSSPPGVSETGTVSAPPATPESEALPLAPDTGPDIGADAGLETGVAAPVSAYADELPPGFWEALEPPEVVRTVGLSAPETHEAKGQQAHEYATSDRAAPKRAVEGSAQGLEGDPRFAALQELFPGRVVAWQARADAAVEAEGTAQTTAYNGDEEPETVDLDEER